MLAGFRRATAGAALVGGQPVFENATATARTCLIRETGDTVPGVNRPPLAGPCGLVRRRAGRDHREEQDLGQPGRTDEEKDTAVRTTPVALAPGRARPPAGVLCPFALTAEPIARFLNCELDDPTYDGLELQYFDDTAHGRGLLAFLSRRADRLVDYYAEPGLALDPATFTVGGGVGAWTETTFDIARLLVADDGVNAEVRFTDVAGRVIEVRIDDRDGRPRRRAELLAPVGAAIDPPGALLLVYLHGFDLVRTGSATASIRIDGRVASPGRLPGVRLHRRHLIKHADRKSVV